MRCFMCISNISFKKSTLFILIQVSSGTRTAILDLWLDYQWIKSVLMIWIRGGTYGIIKLVNPRLRIYCLYKIVFSQTWISFKSHFMSEELPWKPEQTSANKQVNVSNWSLSKKREKVYATVQFSVYFLPKSLLW